MQIPWTPPYEPSTGPQQTSRGCVLEGIKTSKLIGWWEEYKCGCVSKTVRFKKDLLGYCAIHGEDTRYVHPELATRPLA